MANELTSQGNILFYSNENEKEFVQVIFKDDNFWLTQKSMSELFGCTTDNISLHLKNIFNEEELDKNSVTEKFSVTASDGKNYNTQCYNLDAIISVGYRVNSKKATRFRQWATATLKEYIQKGFVLNDDMLKNGRPFGKDYFRELLERVRSIRASERRIWQQITDIYAECSIDYDKTSKTTQDFYAMVQNKFHFAITGKTAAEIVYSLSDHTKDNMGLTTWKNAPNGRILKSDVEVAKNYLDEKQIRQLERTVTGYFDYIEDLIERENAFTMEQFAESINEFLSFRKYDILPDKGTISHKQAMDKAHAEYEIFNKGQKIESDFDKEIKRLKKQNG
ncbi:MAG: virulence RhuM family protein [Eubacterium sp.]